MSDVPMRPDDITDEEEAAALEGYLASGGPSLTRTLSAQNALRDRRVREDERERLAKLIDAEADDAGRNPIGKDLVRGLRWAAATVREGGQHGE